jgi:hypothetical protein
MHAQGQSPNATSPQGASSTATTTNQGFFTDDDPWLAGKDAIRKGLDFEVYRSYFDLVAD